MSLINNMLPELDKRHAGEGDGKTLTQQLRPVQVRKNSELFWRIMAGLMVIVVAWIIWVLYQIAPRPVITDLAFESQAKLRQSAVATEPAAAPQAQPALAEREQPASNPPPAPAAATVVPPAPPAAPVPVSAPVLAPVPAPISPPISVPVPPTAATAKGERPVNVDMLKLATEIVTPFAEKSPKLQANAASKPAPEPAPARKTEPKSAMKPAPEPVLAAKAAIVPPKPATEPLAVPAAEPVAILKAETRLPVPKRGPVSIEKQDRSISPQQRAEGEFRRATGLLNQGRVAEAVDAYKLALQHDAMHQSARQALVALLLESRHANEAQEVLQEGLSLSPGKSSYVMLLGRMLVDRGDVQGAYDLLSRHAGGAGINADYHAFSAALLQRLGRNKEAVTEYQRALRFAPNAGVWWMGLGISLQADKRNAEAADAFRRAKSADGLNADLLTFVDQRLRQLQ